MYVKQYKCKSARAFSILIGSGNFLSLRLRSCSHKLSNILPRHRLKTVDGFVTPNGFVIQYRMMFQQITVPIVVTMGMTILFEAYISLELGISFLDSTFHFALGRIEWSLDPSSALSAHFLSSTSINEKRSQS